MKNALRKFLLFLLVLLFSISVFAADDTKEDETPKYNSGLRFEVAEDVSEGATKLKIKVSGTPKPEAVKGSSLSLTIPSDKVTTNVSTKIPVEMENSTVDIQDPQARLQDPLEIFGVKDTELDASTVIKASNFTFKDIAPNTDISSWIKFQTGLDSSGNPNYVYANELDTDKNKDPFGYYIVPKGLKYEVDEAGTKSGEDTIGIRVYGTPEGEISTKTIKIELPTNIVTRANPYSTRVFAVDGINMELSGMLVSNVRPLLEEGETIIGTEFFPLSKKYDFTISLDFRDKNGNYTTFTGLSVGDDISSWFSDTIKGEGKASISYKVKEITNGGGTKASKMIFTISGTPTEVNTLTPTIMLPRANITELVDETDLPESFVVIAVNSDKPIKYDIKEYPASTAFSAKSVVPGTVGVPYQMDTTVKFNAVDAEVPFKYDDRPLRKINLENGLEFGRAFSDGDDITDWFTNAPEGLTFTVYGDVPKYATSVTFYISGTPASMSKEEIVYTIPYYVLYFSGTVNAGTTAEKVYSHENYIPLDGVEVSGKNRSNYAIYELSLENPEQLFVRGPASSDIETVTATVNLGGNLRFKVARDAGFDISSWFKNVWATNPSGNSDQFKYTLATDVGNGSNIFKFNVSGLQGENGMGGAGIFVLQIPSSLLQDITGATLPNDYNYKVSVSSSYGDIAEEYARIFLANPRLRIISDDKDFYITESFFDTFEVVYQLENAKFDTSKISTEQIYYAWANDSLKKNATIWDENATEDDYDNLWTYFGPDRTQDTIQREKYKGIYTDSYGQMLTSYKNNGVKYIEIGPDVNRGLAVKVQNVTDNQITIMYYGVIREDFLNRGTEPLYLNIPQRYILAGPTNGVTAEDAITLHYEKPVISFVPYGFYADDDLRMQEIYSLQSKIDSYYNQSEIYKYARLSYDLVGVVGQDLSEYSYDAPGNYDNSRTEDYHLYAFAPLNFDLEFNVGDDVTSLFFDTAYDDIGITWRVVAKEKNQYKNLTIEQMNSWSKDGKNWNYLAGRPIDEGYIYIVKAEGIPNFWTDDTEDNEIKVTYYSQKRNIYKGEGTVYNGVYKLNRKVSDPMVIESKLAPSYNGYEAEMWRLGYKYWNEDESRSKAVLGKPTYRFFSLYVPFTDWTYRLKSTDGVFNSYTMIEGKGIVNDRSVNLATAYNSENIATIQQFATDTETRRIYTDFIPIIIDGPYRLSMDPYDSIWQYQYAKIDLPNVKYYIWRNLDRLRYIRNCFTFKDPRVNRENPSDYYLPTPLVYHDQYHNYDRISLAGGADFTHKTYSLGKTSDGRYFNYQRSIGEQGVVYDTPQLNKMFYIALRPASDNYDSITADDLKLVDFVEPFELWVNTALLAPSSASNLYFKYSLPQFLQVDYEKGVLQRLSGIYTLYPPADHSLPKWLKVTPSDPYYKMLINGKSKIESSDIVPGILTSGSKVYRAIFDKQIAIKSYIYQSIESTNLTISLVDTTFKGFGNGYDVTSWFNFPDGVFATVLSLSSDNTSVTLSIEGGGDVPSALNTIEATIPYNLNAAGEDLAVWTKGSTSEIKSFDASFSGSVVGYTNKKFKNSDITLTFSNGMTFDEKLLNKDISSWFTQLGGVNFVVKEISGSTIVVEPQGSPLAETHTSDATIVIPASALTNTLLNTDNFAIFTLNGLKYDISDYMTVSASIPEQVVVLNAEGFETGAQNAFIFQVGLQNTTFDAMQIATDVSSWFGSSKKDGYNYILQKAVAKGSNVATIALYGTPTATYSGSINITIPSSALYNYSEALTVNTKGSLYKEIDQRASIVGNAISIEKYRNNDFYQDFTIEITGGPGFIAISKGYNVSSWFNTILIGNVTYKVLNAVKSGDKQITIRMSTTQATATTYDTAKAYTITIPEMALIYASGPVGVDVKGGTMKFKNYTQPTLSHYLYVIEGKYPTRGLGLLHNPDSFKDFVFWWYGAVTNTKDRATAYTIVPFRRDIDDMKKPYSFLFTFDNILQIGHTSGRQYGYFARYQSYGYLVNDSNAIQEGQYRWHRPWTMSYIGNGQDGDGNVAGTVPSYRWGEENYAYWNDLPEIYVTPRSEWESIMSTDTGMHIPYMMELWVHTFGSSAYYIKNHSWPNGSGIAYNYGIITNAGAELALKSFQVVIFKKNKCSYGSCSLFKQRHGTNKGYVGIDFRVPVIDLGGNKVWVWARDDISPLRKGKSPIYIGHNMY